MTAQSQVPLNIQPTPTVTGTLARLARASAVSAWEIVKDLLSSHPEFGRQKAQDILAGGDPKQEQMKSVDDWFDQVSSLFDPLLVKQLHGRLFILGLLPGRS